MEMCSSPACIRGQRTLHLLKNRNSTDLRERQAPCNGNGPPRARYRKFCVGLMSVPTGKRWHSWQIRVGKETAALSLLMWKLARNGGTLALNRSNRILRGVTFWRGVSITPDGRFINVTTDDGRAFIFSAPTGKQSQQEPIWHQNLATPLEVSGVPILATSGTIGATDAAALFVTGDTYIPYHMQKGAQRPPTAHPNGMTLFAYSWEGKKVWQWQLENMPQGLRIDAAGRYAALARFQAESKPE